MIWLTISIVALGLGILSSTFLERYDSWKSRLHGFVIGFIGLLLFAEILPHSYTHIAWMCGVWFGIGFLLIAGIDYMSNHHSSWISIGLLSLVFGLHALVDGVAIGTQADGTLLAIAIVAHRLPEGLALAGKATTNVSKWILFIVMALASIAGYFSVHELPLISLSTLQALAGGGLAHVLLHAHVEQRAHTAEECLSEVLKTWRVSGFFIAILCYLLIYFIHSNTVLSSHEHHHDHGLDTNIYLVISVGIALFGLIWWEREHSHI